MGHNTRSSRLVAVNDSEGRVAPLLASLCVLNLADALGAAVFTKDVNRAIHVSSALQAETVWVNCDQVSKWMVSRAGCDRDG